MKVQMVLFHLKKERPHHPSIRQHITPWGTAVKIQHHCIGLQNTRLPACDAWAENALFSPNTLHLWPLLIPALASECRSYEKYLSDDERARAARFVRFQDRRRFVICRAMLRKILGLYLDMSPGRVPICYGRKDKPCLPEKYEKPIFFNLSHSGDMALMGFSHNLQLGVDIEQARPVEDICGVAELIMSPQELDTFRSLEGSDRTHFFFDCWVFKEALTKALGEGLHLDLKSIDICADTHSGSAITEVCDATGSVIRLHLHKLSLTPNYTSAVAFYPAEAPSKRRTA